MISQDELANALTLHRTMLKLCSATDPGEVFRALPAFLTFLEATSWLQRAQVVEAIHDLQERGLTLTDFLESGDLAGPQALHTFARDLAI